MYFNNRTFEIIIFNSRIRFFRCNLESCTKLAKFLLIKASGLFLLSIFIIADEIVSKRWDTYNQVGFCLFDMHAHQKWLWCILPISFLYNISFKPVGSIYSQECKHENCKLLQCQRMCEELLLNVLILNDTVSKLTAGGIMLLFHQEDHYHKSINLF